MGKRLFGCADLHIHTDASDGVASVVEVLNFVAKYRKLNAIAITDHDTLDASLWAYERQHLYPFEIIPALEVTARDAHILGLWVTKPIPTNMTIQETTAAIHEQGGLAILAHPFHPYMPNHSQTALRYFRRPEGLLEAGIDGLEAYNGGIAGTGFNWIANQIARKIGIAVTGGSDAHTLGAIGTGETLFAGNHVEDLYQAIIKKKTEIRGRAWSITDYAGYLRHERQRKARKSSETIKLFPQTSHSRSLQLSE